MTAASRRRAWRLGRWAETLCILDLALRGYRIVSRRRRYPVGEIDIVARRGNMLAIIEVKARPTVSARQRRRIARAADWFAAENPGLAPLQRRFDVMLVTPWRRPRHITNAWHDHDR